MRVRAHVDRIDERRRLALDLTQPFVQIAQQLRTKTGSDRSDVPQRLILIDAEQQGSESLTAAFRIGPAANDELLLVAGFDLHPIAAAPLLIRRSPVLSDDAFQTAF